MLSDLCDFSSVYGFSGSAGLFDSPLMPVEGSFLALSLEIFDKLLFAPSNLSGEVSQVTELPEAGELDASHGLRNVLLFGSVVGGGHSLEDFESAKGGGSSCGFVREHSSDTPPEDSRGCAVVDEGPSGVS